MNPGKDFNSAYRLIAKYAVRRENDIMSGHKDSAGYWGTKMDGVATTLLALTGEWCKAVVCVNGSVVVFHGDYQITLTGF